MPVSLRLSSGVCHLSACLTSVPASRSRVANAERASTAYAGAATSRADLQGQQIGRLRMLPENEAESQQHFQHMNAELRPEIQTS